MTKQSAYWFYAFVLLTAIPTFAQQRNYLYMPMEPTALNPDGQRSASNSYLFVLANNKYPSARKVPAFQWMVSDVLGVCTMGDPAVDKNFGCSDWVQSATYLVITINKQDAEIYFVSMPPTPLVEKYVLAPANSKGIPYDYVNHGPINPAVFHLPIQSQDANQTIFEGQPFDFTVLAHKADFRVTFQPTTDFWLGHIVVEYTNYVQIGRSWPRQKLKFEANSFRCQLYRCGMSTTGLVFDGAQGSLTN